MVVTSEGRLKEKKKLVEVFFLGVEICKLIKRY